MTLERPVVFDCNGHRLVGILHESKQASARGLVIVVGGPQYRVGSHRQFVQLARYLAARGTPVLRFDYRGMGDSEGPSVTFEEVMPDIAAALDFFVGETKVRDVALWGLCDAASAVMLYAPRDERVAGIVCVNPWVRREQTEARAYLRHYYWARLRDPAQWRRLVTGGIHIARSVRGLAQIVRARFARAGDGSIGVNYVSRMREAFASFRGRALIILSGDDLTASEFKDEVASSKEWSDALRRTTVSRYDLAAANHTFAKEEWRACVAVWTEQWLASL